MELKKDSNLAEFIGVLLGDGSIAEYHSNVNGKTKTQYRVKITGDAQEDLPYFKEYLIPLITNIFNKEPLLRFKTNERTVELLLFGAEIFQSLLDLGIVQAPKKGRCVVPTFITEQKLQKHFLRGFFDTDGSVVFDKQHTDKHYYPRLEMKIDDSPMRKQIITILKSLNFNPRICQQKGEIWRVQLNGKAQFKRWSEEITFNNYKHLTKRFLWVKLGYYQPGLTLQERIAILSS
jgi:DNA-binding transcriptional regulator WhiA